MKENWQAFVSKKRRLERMKQLIIETSKLVDNIKTDLKRLEPSPSLMQILHNFNRIVAEMNSHIGHWKPSASPVPNLANLSRIGAVDRASLEKIIKDMEVVKGQVDQLGSDQRSRKENVNAHLSQLNNQVDLIQGELSKLKTELVHGEINDIKMRVGDIARGVLNLRRHVNNEEQIKGPELLKNIKEKIQDLSEQLRSHLESSNQTSAKLLLSNIQREIHGLQTTFSSLREALAGNFESRFSHFNEALSKAKATILSHISASKAIEEKAAKMEKIMKGLQAESVGKRPSDDLNPRVAALEEKIEVMMAGLRDATDTKDVNHFEQALHDVQNEISRLHAEILTKAKETGNMVGNLINNHVKGTYMKDQEARHLHEMISSIRDAVMRLQEQRSSSVDLEAVRRAVEQVQNSTEIGHLRSELLNMIEEKMRQTLTETSSSAEAMLEQLKTLEAEVRLMIQEGQGHDREESLEVHQNVYRLYDIVNHLEDELRRLQSKDLTEVLIKGQELMKALERNNEKVDQLRERFDETDRAFNDTSLSERANLESQLATLKSELMALRESTIPFAEPVVLPLSPQDVLHVLDMHDRAIANLYAMQAAAKPQLFTQDVDSLQRDLSVVKGLMEHHNKESNNSDIIYNQLLDAAMVLANITRILDTRIQRNTGEPTMDKLHDIYMVKSQCDKQIGELRTEMEHMKYRAGTGDNERRMIQTSLHDLINVTMNNQRHLMSLSENQAHQIQKIEEYLSSSHFDPSKPSYEPSPKVVMAMPLQRPKGHPELEQIHTTLAEHGSAIQSLNKSLTQSVNECASKVEKSLLQRQKYLIIGDDSDEQRIENENHNKRSATKRSRPKRSLPADCSGDNIHGLLRDGPRLIQPRPQVDPMRVLCKSGLTVVQHRSEHSPVNFSRTWQDYKFGFGKLNGDFWLGLEPLRNLLMSFPYSLILSLNDGIVDHFVRFDTLEIGPEEAGYPIRATRFTSDTLENPGGNYFNGSTFMTRDHRMAECEVKIGWWYRDCNPSTNLNNLEWRTSMGVMRLKEVTMLLEKSGSSDRFPRTLDEDDFIPDDYEDYPSNPDFDVVHKAVLVSQPSASSTSSESHKLPTIQLNNINVFPRSDRIRSSFDRWNPGWTDKLARMRRRSQRG